MHRGTKVGLAIVLVAGVLAAVVFFVARLQRLPSEPVDIMWDRETCAQCHMLVGDPAFAAQLQTKEGSVLNFDDPGCLFTYERNDAPAVHAEYFHEMTGARWLPRDRVAFLPVPRSPMGYDLGAVEVGTAGSISIDEARERVVGPRARGVDHGPR